MVTSKSVKSVWVKSVWVTERGLYAKPSGRAPAYSLAYVQGFKRSWIELYNEHFPRHFLLGVNKTVVWTFYSASLILIDCLSINI